MASKDETNPLTFTPSGCCPRPHPKASWHGELEQIFSNVWFVQGTAVMSVLSFLPSLKFQRAMTIVRVPAKSGDALILFNTVRLNDEGLQALDALGRVTHIVRLAYFHGQDDPFYKERYPNATVWAPDGAPYFPGVDPKAMPYFVPDKVLEGSKTTIVPGVDTCVLQSGRFPEALAFLTQQAEGRVLISGDALQNFSSQAAPQTTDCLSMVVLRCMGFYVPYNVGPAWAQQCRPDANELLNLLLLDQMDGDGRAVVVDHVLPSHGMPVLGQASQKFRPAIEKLIMMMRKK